MDILILLTLIFFFIPLALFTAWLILSSCLGDSFRDSITASLKAARKGSYGRTYARNMTPHGGWEQIEMHDMLGRGTGPEFED